MSANFTEWYLQIVDARRSAGSSTQDLDDDAGIFDVLTANDPARVTLYSDERGTAKTAPGTMTNGIIQFWTASTVTSVDITVQTTQGHSFFLEDVTPSQHRIVVNSEKLDGTLILPYKVVGASEAIVNTGFSVLSMMAVRDVFLHTTTLGTGAIIDFGTSTDTDGFLDGISVDTTGFKVLAEGSASNAGVGDLLSIDATNGGHAGRKFYMQANGTSGASIVYTNTTSSSTAGAGYIYITYLRVPA